MADVESPSATQPFCVWSQDTRKFALHIPSDVLSNLSTEALVAFKRVPHRGLETGGILLGRADIQGHTTTFWIEGFAPIESEHRFGPSYLLSDSDLSNLQTGLTMNKTASIGIYRSQTRSEQLAIQDADVGLFEKCFGGSDNLFLMLAPLPRIGAVYFRGEGKLKCVHQFALVSSIAAPSRTPLPQANLPSSSSSGIHNVHANIARHSEDQVDPVGTVSTINQGTETMPSAADLRQSFGTDRLRTAAIRQSAGELWSNWKGRISGVKLGSWLLAALTLVVLTVNLLSYSFRRPAMPIQRAPNYLYLTVERIGPALRLRWDANNSVVRSATRAILHIQDGEQQSDKELAPSEFLSGQYSYQPQHSAVTFRLNAYAGEPNAIGLVQVMLPPSPIPAAPSIAPVVLPTQVNRPPAQFNGSPAQPHATPIAHSEEHPAQSPPPVESSDKKDNNVETPPPAVRLPEAPNTRQQNAREASIPAGFEEPKWHSLQSERHENSTTRRELKVQASTTAVPNSRLGGLFGKIPFVGRLRKQSKVLEAVPVYQAHPIVRLPNDQQLTRPITVGIKVYVGESGVVDGAEVVDYGDDPLSPALVNASLEAARSWTFAPSRADDIPVASQLMIHFYFSP